jgi:hypothetical protein
MEDADVVNRGYRQKPGKENMDLQKTIRAVLSALLAKPLRIQGVTNKHMLSQPGLQDRPVRIETLYAHKGLTGAWTVLQDQSSPMLPRGVLMRQGVFGGRGTPVVFDEGRKITTTILAKGLSFREAFDRVRAAEETAKPLTLTTSRGCALPASYVMRNITLVQSRPESDPTSWRNLP